MERKNHADDDEKTQSQTQTHECNKNHKFEFGNHMIFWIFHEKTYTSFRKKSFQFEFLFWQRFVSTNICNFELSNNASIRFDGWQFTIDTEWTKNDTSRHVIAISRVRWFNNCLLRAFVSHLPNGHRTTNKNSIDTLRQHVWCHGNYRRFRSIIPVVGDAFQNFKINILESACKFYFLCFRLRHDKFYAPYEDLGHDESYKIRDLKCNLLLITYDCKCNFKILNCFQYLISKFGYLVTVHGSFFVN